MVVSCAFWTHLMEPTPTASIIDIDWLRQRHPHWKGLSSIIAVTAQHETNGKINQKTCLLRQAQHKILSAV